MKKIKLFLGIIFTVLVLAVSVDTAAAVNAVNPDTDTGNIAVTLKKEGAGIAGVQVYLYRVGTGKVENSQLLFELLPELQGAAVELNGLSGAQNMEAAAKLRDFIRVQGLLSPEILGATTDASGTANFEDLPVGVYLVQSRANADWQTITPHLLYLPAKSDEGTSWDFDVNGEPKVQAQPSGGGGDSGDPLPTEVPPAEKPTPPIPGEEPGREPTEPAPVSPENPVPVLPQTGLLQWPVPLMTAGGLLLIVLGIQIKRRGHT